MKLVDLNNYILNDFDKNIFKRMTKDSEANLNNYVCSVICDLVNFIPMEKELKKGVKENIKNCDEIELGEIATYTSLIPYVQLELKDNKDVAIIANSLVEKLISYVVGYLSKEEFDKNLENIQGMLNISYMFYDGLVKYFTFNKEYIVNTIVKNIK